MKTSKEAGKDGGTGERTLTVKVTQRARKTETRRTTPTFVVWVVHNGEDIIPDEPTQLNTY